MGAKIKLPDLNCSKISSAMNSVMGTAKNMGIKIEGLDGWMISDELRQEVDARQFA